jgi:hypothetical protein
MEGMAQRSTRRDRENQITNVRLYRARPADMDPIRELPYGPAARHGRITEAGNTSAPDHAPRQPSKYFLHRRGRPNTLVTVQEGREVGAQNGRSRCARLENSGQVRGSRCLLCVAAGNSYRCYTKTNWPPRLPGRFTFALKAGLWFRRDRPLIIAPALGHHADLRRKLHLAPCADFPSHLCRRSFG